MSAVPPRCPAQAPPSRTGSPTIGAILGAFTAILDIQITNSSLANIEGAIGALARAGQLDLDRLPDGRRSSSSRSPAGSAPASSALRRYLSINTALFIVFSVLVRTVDLAAAS